MQILILGGSGFIGGCLAQALTQRQHRVDYTFTSRRLPASLGATAHLLDLTRVRSDDLAELVATLRPDVVFHCAVMPLSGDYIHHHSVNAYSVPRLTQALAQSRPDAPVIYLSTDAVFAGRTGGLYCEYDETDARIRKRSDVYRNYGVTRALGEALLRQHWPSNHLIVRTSHVDGHAVDGELSPRLAALLAQLQNNIPTKRLIDRFFTPTLVDSVIEAVVEMLDPAFSYRGTLHVAGRQRVSHYEHALALAKHIGADASLILPERLAESRVPDLPVDTSLDVSLAQSLLRTPMLDLQEQLGRINFDASL